MNWTVVIPAKSLPEAKSRLAGSSDARSHERLVLAIRADTVAAARAAANVSRVVVIAEREAVDPSGADFVFVQGSSGLNAALREAAEICARRWPGDGVAALVGDLPALRADELDAALEQAAEHRLAYVVDSHATGTTMLTAQPGVQLDPHFGAGSAAQHALIAAPLAGAPGLRQDVDTDSDLAQALRLGVGSRTLAATSMRSLFVHLD